MTNWITHFNGRTSADLPHTTEQISTTVSQAAQELGFQELNYVSFDQLEDQPERRQALIKTILGPVQPGDFVAVQFPLWEQLDFQAGFIDHLKQIEQVKLVAIVHEVPTWIYADQQDKKELESDFWLTQLKKFDLLIVANDKQAQRLVIDHVDVPMISLELWDYPYAGPLEQKQFRKQLHYMSDRTVTGLTYHAATPLTLYNRVIDDKVKDNPSVTYQPKTSRDQLIASLDGGFGLVNADNIREAELPNDVSNNQYSNPLELSMYLTAGLPVIVPQTSAHADLVKQHHLGLVIQDLNDIDEILTQVTAADYQEMLTAIVPWKRAVSSRFFMKRSLMAAMRTVNLGYQQYLIKK